MNRAASVIVACLLALPASSAFGCGYCVEDRVAAVYDQEVIEASARAHRTVAFFAIEGDVRDDAESRRAVAAALRGAGAAAGTPRVVLANAAASMAYDPARTS